MNQLKKRGRHLANRCTLCAEEEENTDHSLLHCKLARDLWALLFAIFGINWVLPCSVKETLLSWKDSFARKKCKNIWMPAPLCLFWTV